MIEDTYGVEENDISRDYIIDPSLEDPGHFDRCNWLLKFRSDGYYVCLFQKHKGDVHKILDGNGEIRTVKVIGTLARW